MSRVSSTKLSSQMIVLTCCCACASSGATLVDQVDSLSPEAGLALDSAATETRPPPEDVSDVFSPPDAHSYTDAPRPSSGHDTGLVDAKTLDSGVRVNSLAVCRRYFESGSDAISTFMETNDEFYIAASRRCHLAGFVEHRTPCQTVIFMNHLLDWSLLLFGCEPHLPEPPELSEFGKGTFVEGLELSLIDVNRLVATYVEVILAAVALNEDDALRLQLAVEAGFSRLGAERPDASSLLDRCGAADAGPADAAVDSSSELMGASGCPILE